MIRKKKKKKRRVIDNHKKIISSSWEEKKTLERQNLEGKIKLEIKYLVQHITIEFLNSILKLQVDLQGVV